MKIPKEYQDRYMWPKWLRIIQAVLLVFNALLVILAVFTCTFSPIFVSNVLWAGFFGCCLLLLLVRSLLYRFFLLPCLLL